MTRLIAILSLAAGSLLTTTPASATLPPYAVAAPSAARSSALVEFDFNALFGFDAANAVALSPSDRPGSDLGMDLQSFADGAAGAELASDLMSDPMSNRGSNKRARAPGSKPPGAAADSRCTALGQGPCNAPEPATYALVSLAVLASLVPGALRRRRDKGDKASNDIDR